MDTDSPCTLRDLNFEAGHWREWPLHCIPNHTENILYLSHGYTTVGSWFFFNNGVHFVTVIYVCLFLERNLLSNITEKCYVMKPCLVWKRSNKNYVFTPVTFPPQSPFHPSHLSTPVTFPPQSPFRTSHLSTPVTFLHFLRFLRLLHQLSFITFLY